MELNGILNHLIEIAKKNNNCIDEEEILKFVDIDSDFYDTVEETLEKEGIDILVKEEPVEIQEDFSEEETMGSSLLSQYLKEITKIPLLTLDEEKFHTKRIFEGMEAEEKLNSGDFTSEEYPILMIKKSDGLASKEKMVNANLRLVVSIVKKYAYGSSMSIMDLIQEGNMGLIRALEKFDYRKEIKFSTYATWWIRQSAGRAINEQGRTIRLPVHLAEFKNKVRRKEVELTQLLGRAPTEAEIAEELEISERKVSAIKNYGADILSLEAKVNDEKDATLGDFISDDSTPTPSEKCYAQKKHDELYGDMSKLNPREQLVLQLRFGLEDGNPHTLEEVGQVLNITRERVRQIETVALRKLKKMYVFREQSLEKS